MSLIGMADTIDQKEANTALYIAGAVIILLIIGLFTNGFGLFNGQKNDPALNNTNGGTFVKLEIGDAPVLGDANAPITLYEFSDFSCPFCAVAAGAVPTSDPKFVAPLPAVEEKYVRTGKVKIVFKYYSGHGSGVPAHFVGWCLNEQNASLFWTFHDRAFAQQANVGDTTKMQSLAQELGADMSRLQECLTSARYASLLQQDPAMGRSNGVRATPTFILNGKVVEGVVPFGKLDAMIQEELAKSE